MLALRPPESIRRASKELKNAAASSWHTYVYRHTIIWKAGVNVRAGISFPFGVAGIPPANGTILGPEPVSTVSRRRSGLRESNTNVATPDRDTNLRSKFSKEISIVLKNFAFCFLAGESCAITPQNLWAVAEISVASLLF